MTSWPSELDKLQDPKSYVDGVLKLRRERQLHPLFEWRVQELIKNARPSIHAQPEKWGVSSGRIDLAAYVSTRCILHYELIASATSNQVFRDTTSLLVSRADTKLAVLVDSDVDRTVCDRFFSAIPAGEIDWIYLRDVLLVQEEEKTLERFRRTISQAEYVAGSVSNGAFSCQLSDYNLEVYRTYKLTYSGLEAPDYVRVYLSLLPTEALILTKVEGHTESGEIDFELPWHDLLKPGEYRVCVSTRRGLRWSSWIRISAVPPPPIIVLTKAQAAIGDEVQFEVRNFPGDRAFRLSLRQGNAGIVVFTRSLPNDRALSGSFRVPSVHADYSMVEAGVHPLTGNCRGCRADTYLEVLNSGLPDEVVLEDTITTSGNELYNLSLSRIVATTRRLRCRFEIINSSPYPLRLTTAVCVVRLPDRRLVEFMAPAGTDGPIIEPGKAKVFDKDFFTSQTDDKCLEGAPNPVQLQFVAVVTKNNVPVPVVTATRDVPLGVLRHVLASAESKGEAT